jgi:hypothetical protein
MEILKLNNDYISQDTTILNEIYNFQQNKYILKSRPGIGLTTSYLNYRKGNLIIICPSAPIVYKKSLNLYEADKNFFKCHKLKENKWQEVENYLSYTPEVKQNLVITCTPESLNKLYDLSKSGENILMETFKTFPIVVDEYDTIVRQSNFREECGRFVEILFREWCGKYVLTTATPNYNFIDVPEDEKICYIKIEKSIEKQINLNYSENYTDAFLFMEEELKKGNKVACYSNNFSVHKRKINELQASYSGKKLCRKLDAYNVDNRYDIPINPFKGKDLIVFSGRYFCGYDIEEDLSIVIINETKLGQPATLIDPNLAVQALFRCRGKIKNALFVNSKNFQFNPDQNQVKHHLEIYKANLAHYEKFSKIYNPIIGLHYDMLTVENFVNRSRLLVPSLHAIHIDMLSNENKIIEEFKKFKIKLKEYKPQIQNSVKIKNPSFNNRILNLSNDSTTTVKQKYLEEIEDIIIYKSKGEQIGSYSPKHLLERLTAYIIQELQLEGLSKDLKNNKLRPTKFYSKINKILQKNYPRGYFSEYYKLSDKTLEQIEDLENKPLIDEKLINDWHLLYCINTFTYKNLKNTQNTNYREIIIYLVKNDWTLIKDFINNKKNRINLSISRIKSELRNVGITLKENEINNITETVKQQFKKTKHYPVSLESLAKKFKNTLCFLLTPKRNFNLNGSRDYNPLTQLPKFLRKYIPFKYSQLDISSANPQFVDIIVNSNMASKVYDNLSNNKSISRDLAKKIYNATLNKHYLSQTEAERFYYVDCGYPATNAKALSKLTANVEKGSFFKNMTSKESMVINYYIDINLPHGIRLHDAIVIPPWKIPDVFPKSHYNIDFKLSDF